MKYSASTGCFYPSDIGYSSLPTDLIEVDAETYALAMSRPAGATLAVVDGGLVIIDPPVQTPEELARSEQQRQRSQLNSAIQRMLDIAAQACGYDDIGSAVTYAEEPAVPLFQVQGRAFRAWRSLVWWKAGDIEAAVKAGLRLMPTADELLAEMPDAPDMAAVEASVANG